MAYVLMPQCNFLYGYFSCQLPEYPINVKVTILTVKGIYTFKRDHATQIISCRPWSPQLLPYSSLARKMRTYLDMRENTTNALCPNLTYPDRPNTPLPQKPQASRKRMVRESKKRNKNHQASRRQYKVRRIENLFCHPRQ